MSDVVLVLVVGVITFASRVIFMVKPQAIDDGPLARFLDVFPLALFVAIATSGLVAPNGMPEITPGIAAAAGGIVGAALFKKSLLAILAIGATAFYLTRYLVG